jgi:hypothetical protein
MKAVLNAPSAKIARKLLGSRHVKRVRHRPGAQDGREHDVAREAGQPRKERVAADGEDTTEHPPLLQHGTALQNGEIRMKTRGAQP